MIDIHCHILWGVDDGPQTFQESLDMCRKAANDGIGTIVASPHCRNGVYNVSADQVFSGVEKLNKVLKKENINTKVIPGHENHIHPYSIQDIEDGTSLTINNNKKYILIEMPVESVPFYIEAFITSMNKKGITSIISHPERNTHIQANISILENLIKKGALTEITAMSITGDFGASAKKSAMEMLKKNLVHTIASDAHSLNKRPPILSRAVKTAEKIISPKFVQAMVVDTPLKIINTI